MALLFPLALGLTLSFAILVNAQLKIQHKTVYIIGLFLIAYAEIVLISELASLFHLIYPAFYLAAHFIFCGIAWFVWRRNNRPDLFKHFRNILSSLKSGWPGLKTCPDLLLMATIVGVVYLVGAILSIQYPQNNFDSMTYHLSRVGYWMQHGSLAPWVTPNPRQTTFPINAELGILWTTIFLRSDRLSGMIQWTAWLVSSFAIYGLARLLGASRKQSIFAALLWSTFPEIALQSVTTMNDLTASAFFISSIYLLYLGYRENHIPYLALSGLGLALAIGTKSTTLLILPGLVLVLLLIYGLNRKSTGRTLARWGLIGSFSFILVGIFGYAQNTLFYHNPFSVSQWTNDLINLPVSRIEMTVKNLGLYANQFFDPTGLPPPLGEPLSILRTKAANFILHRLPVLSDSQGVEWRQQLHFILGSTGGVHEDIAWFGILGFIFITTALVYQAYQGLLRKEPFRLGLVLLVLSFAVVLSAFSLWTPYRGRYFVLAATLSAPLLYSWYPLSRRSWLWRWVISLAAIWILVWTFLLNGSRPLVGENAVWGKTYSEARTLNNRAMLPVLNMVERNVPANARLATRLSEDAWDYPLFGANFQRILLPTDPQSITIDLEWLSAQAIDYLLVEPRQRPFLQQPRELELLDQVDGWTLYRHCPTAACIPDPEQERIILGITDAHHLMTIAPGLVGQVGILELKSSSWEIETVSANGLLWLGEGDMQGLRGFLWSEKERTVLLVIEASPGPSKVSPDRTLTFKFFRRQSYNFLVEGRRIEQYHFIGPADSLLNRLVIPLELQYGLNEFRLSSADLATIQKLPNGDTRPLLILIQKMTLEE